MENSRAVWQVSHDNQPEAYHLLEFVEQAWEALKDDRSEVRITYIPEEEIFRFEILAEGNGPHVLNLRCPRIQNP